MVESVLNFEGIRKRYEKLLSVPVGERNDEDLFQLMRLTSDLVLFEHCKMTNTHKEVCKNIFIKPFNKGAIIFKQGAEPDGYYFVLKGAVDLYVYDIDNENGKTRLKYLTSVNPGHGFGELALMYECPRTATAIACNYTELILVKKKIYETYIKEIHEKSLIEIVKFFYSIPILKKEPISNILKYCLRTTKSILGTKEFVLPYGEQLNCYVFVKSGIVKAFYPIKMNKYILKNLNKMSEEKFIKSLIEIQGKSIGDGNDDRIIYEEIIDIMEFVQGDMIAEYYASNNNKLDVYLLPHVPSEILYFKLEYIHEINPKLFDAIQRYSAPIFDPERVFKKLYNNLVWKADKKNLLNNLKKYK